MDAMDKATVDGFLDFLNRRAVRVDYFSQNIVIHAECFRDSFHTVIATETDLLVNTKFSCHD